MTKKLKDKGYDEDGRVAFKFCREPMFGANRYLSYSKDPSLPSWKAERFLVGASRRRYVTVKDLLESIEWHICAS